MTMQWIKVADAADVPEGRVRTVTAGTHSFALTHLEGEYTCLENRCPHQGGPLGEGSIENGLLRCPWHGWDYHPCTGKAPGFDDGVEVFPTEVRDGSVYVGVEEDVAHVRTVSDVIAETLVNWGVTHVFGMVGHSNLGLADALRRLEVTGKLTYIGVRHEGAAAFAVSGFGKLTGRPAACLAIAGPGATNLLTGLWDARSDRVPAIALTGQVATQVLGPGNFQEVDLASAFAAVTCFSQTVLPNSKHAELANLTVKHALVQRDVSHLIFPDEVQNIEVPDAEAGTPEGRLADVAIAPSADALSQALAAMSDAQRPVFIVGYGAREHTDSVIALAERLGAPVLTTFKGKGLISDRHPLGCGVLGRSGTPVASWFMNESDLLVVFGASFSNHTGITSKIKTIQVDFDRLALGRFHAIDIPVWGEIGATCAAMHEALAAHTPATNRQGEIAERWEIWRNEKQRRLVDDRGRGVNSTAVFAALTRHVPDDAVLAVDVGNNTYSFGRYFECTRQSVLMSGYLGSIGFGFSAAMGAWCAAPERTIVSISGDGGFGQYMGEVTTAVKYGMNITHVLLNNSELGKISKEQRAGEWEVWQTSLHNPNFAQFAENCGALGLRVTSADELDDALTRALAHDGPALVEVITDTDLI